MTGGGWVDGEGIRVRHGFALACDVADKPRNLQVTWGRGEKFHLTRMTSAVCTDDPAIDEEPPPAGFDTHRGSGIGRYNRDPDASVRWTFTDAGEPGTEDMLHLEITDSSGRTVLVVAGNLDGGNHQAHRH